VTTIDAEGVGRDRRAGVPVEWVVAGIGLLVFVAALWRHRFFFHDDAYITLRYARHLAEHGDLAWNLGERTEGYTSLLHVTLLAGLIKLGVSPVAAAIGLNVVAVSVLVWAAVRAARRIVEDPVAVGAVGFVVAATPAVAIWTLGGLEAVIVAALLVVVLDRALTLAAGDVRRAHVVVAAVAASAAVLTRLDASVAIAGIAAGLFLSFGDERRRRWREAAAIVAVPAAVALLQMAVRRAVYGLAFPLTFYAKTGSPLSLRLSNAWHYLLDSWSWMPVTVLALIGLVVSIVRARHDRVLPMIAGAFVCQLAVVVWEGGDHMIAGRMLVPLVVPAVLLVVVLGRSVPPMFARGATASAVAVTLVATIAHGPVATDPAAYVGEVVGRYIDEAWPPGSEVALHTAGSTPFYADDLVYIDMLGLNDPTIARRDHVPRRAPFQDVPGHGKGDGAYVLERAPDFVIAGVAEGSPVEVGLFLTDVELAESPEFAACYELRQVDLPYDPHRFGRGPQRPDPLPFRYYERVCGPPG
jgi:hypothetical protein